LADLDGDGRLDLLSGSWPGEIYWFRRAADGQWEEAEILKHSSGKPINVGSASAVAPVDIDGDGAIDLIIGEISGDLYLVPNEGSPKAPAFGKAEPLKAGGSPAKVGGDAGPAIADFDGDGVLDLVCGDGEGAVWLFRGERKDGRLQFAAGQNLIEGISHEDQMAMYTNQKSDPEGAGFTRNQMRAKVAVCDWNGDGHQDLLVGDFASTFGEEPDLTGEQIAERDRLQRQRDELNPKMGEIYQKVSERIFKKLGAQDYSDLSSDQQQEYARLWGEELEADEEAKALQEQWTALWGQLREFERPYYQHGWVWLYLQEPPAAAAAAAEEVISLRDAADRVDLPAPTADKPLVAGAATSAGAASSGDTVTLIVRARLARGWHVYTAVPESQPYIVTQATLTLPDGLEPLGPWRTTEGVPDPKHPGLRLAREELALLRTIRVTDAAAAGSAAITCKLTWQICSDDGFCLPPESQELLLTLDIKPSEPIASR
jgi:hypothetical protein